MAFLFFVLGLLIQGIPVRPSEGGTVTGSIRTTDGKPASGVRVAARTRTDSLEETAEGASLAGIAETDASGRYRLEGVPPGRYIVSAGRVDLPTHYPGTLDLASATVLAVKPGDSITGIDFTVADMSVVLAGASSIPAVTIPLKVTVDGGGKVPVFADGNFVRLVVGSTVTSLGASSIVLPFPNVPREYRVTIQDLPRGYSLKSMAYRAANLMTDSLRLSAADLPLTTGATSEGSTSSRSASELSITLTSSVSSSPQPAGLRVGGRAENIGVRSIYLSNTPGTVYSDGSFEFRGVSRGRHTIMTPDNPQSYSPLGALLIVGDRDLGDVELEPVLVLPHEAPLIAPREERAAGRVIPLAGIRGRVLSAATEQPMRAVLSVIGAGQVSIPIGPDGRFEIPKLLPGSYTLQVSAFDYFTLNETVVIDEVDVSVELRARRAY
jgi:hypothetical protein